MNGVVTLSEVLEYPSSDSEARGLGHYVFEVLAAKRADAKYYRFMKNVIAVSGRIDPVLIINGVVIDGHHRIAIAMDLGYTEIEWTDDPMSAFYEE